MRYACNPGRDRPRIACLSLRRVDRLGESREGGLLPVPVTSVCCVQSPDRCHGATTSQPRFLRHEFVSRRGGAPNSSRQMAEAHPRDDVPSHSPTDCIGFGPESFLFVSPLPRAMDIRPAAGRANTSTPHELHTLLASANPTTSGLFHSFRQGFDPTTALAVFTSRSMPGDYFLHHHGT